MITKITIDPVTRISGFLEIQVEIDNNKVVEAKSGGMLFRGFEKILKDREPLDAIYLTERICGICSTAHAYASTVALEDALNIKASEFEKIVRDIIHGTEFIQNHIRHFYLFTVPDYVKLQEVSSIYKCDHNDFRIPYDITKRIQQNYIESIKYGRMAHEALAVFGGKAPHNHGIFVGGVNTNLYTNISAGKISKIKSILSEIKEFVKNKMFQDGYTIARYYNDYFLKGESYGNMMSYGLYGSSYIEPQVYLNGKHYKLNENYISENASEKQDYSFINAPRYNGYAMEVGPLARMYLCGRYKRGISAMDRMLARILETELIIEILEEKINNLEEIINSKVALETTKYDILENTQGKGLIDTVRGSLGHWLSIKNGKIEDYNIITPSTWNLSPIDSNGIHGAMEMALIGTTIEDLKNPVELGRIIRTFDPCVSCATHVIIHR